MCLALAHTHTALGRANECAVREHTRGERARARRPTDPPTTTLLITQRRAHGIILAWRANSALAGEKQYKCTHVCPLTSGAGFRTPPAPTKKEKSLARHGAWMRDARSSLALLSLFIFASHCERP